MKKDGIEYLLWRCSDDPYCMFAADREGNLRTVGGYHHFNDECGALVPTILY